MAGARTGLKGQMATLGQAHALCDQRPGSEQEGESATGTGF